MTIELHRRTFVGAAATALTGVVGASGQTAASTGDSVYTTEFVCVRDSPGGVPIDDLDAGTGGYVVDGPVSDSYTWWEVSFNEDGDSSYTHCMAETDGPVTGWVPGYALTAADFAYPINGTVYREWTGGGHEALDLAANFGDYVYVPVDGTVQVADAVDDSPCGRRVVVDHGNEWTTRYCHLQEVTVEKGQPVARGDQLGTVGTTGDAFEPHVAFQIRWSGTSQSIPGVRGRQLLAASGVPKDYW